VFFNESSYVQKYDEPMIYWIRYM